ncbi:MAG: prepilin-type N-terminal cleavage/methylation domain-containing protein [Coriobacteriales bacterium]|nr:prepilin-type N-terminal cleavage/methylation domain-containing protein [Coriobacteriales bacterium]
MKDYLKLRKEELKKRGAKGFTLMEMLIVVAIIAVLIAIAIPIFTSQLEKSREATDMANVRSAYAECSASVLSGVKTANDVTVDKTGAGVVTATKTVTLNQTKTGWEGEAPKIADITVGDWGPGTVTVTVKDNGDAPSFTYTAS